MLTPNAIGYTLRHLLSVALPTEAPLAFTFQIDEQRISVTVAEQLRLHIALLSDEEYDAFLSGKATPTLLDSADRKIAIPFFLPKKESGKHLEHNLLEKTLTIPYDILSPVFALLSREEEYNDLPRDEHNRFLFAYSLTRCYDCIDVPLADEYAMLLREWIVNYLQPEIAIRPRAFRIVPTHDIDLLYRFKTPGQAFKSIFGRDLLIDRNLTLVQTSLREYQNWRDDNRQDPYLVAIQELIQESAARGLESHFFIKAQVPDEHDCTYDVNDPLLLYCVDQIRRGGMQMGLHGSYSSYQEPERYLAEKERLEKIIGRPVTEGRQHYLRFCLRRNLSEYSYGGCSPRRQLGDFGRKEVRHQNTLQVWQAAHLQHDYTLGYAERPGFRCGTCHPYPLYDLDNDCATSIIEHPLIVMDGSLFDYLKLNFDDSNDLIARLRQRCQAVEGDFVLLWHNHLASRAYRQAYEQVYLPAIGK